MPSNVPALTFPTAPATPGVTQLRKENNKAIHEYLLRKAHAPVERTPCEHKLRRIRFCNGAKGDASSSNLGHWFTYCSHCHWWEWLSDPLPITELLEKDLEFYILMAIRDNLRPRRRTPTEGGRGKRGKGGNAHQAHVSLEPTPILSSHITLVVWYEVRIRRSVPPQLLIHLFGKNFGWPHRIDIPRSMSGVFSLSDHKVVLGAYGMEREDVCEIYEVGSNTWSPIAWDKFIFSGPEREIYFRHEGVTVCPCFSTIHTSAGGLVLH